MKRLIGLSLLLAFSVSAAQLPDTVKQELAKANIPAESVGIEVREAGKTTPLISHRTEQGMNPASTMKLLTVPISPSEAPSFFPYNCFRLCDIIRIGWRALRSCARCSVRFGEGVRYGV